jgi:hypothetical protein
MRALPSSSRDLPLLLPEWMLFPLLQMAACRTLEMLARGTGLRGDATRAPMQVRNGWRPHRRHLTQPASLSKDDRFFVQTMGSTSTQLLVLKRPPIIKHGRAIEFEVISALFDQSRINGNNNPLGRSVEEQMVARTRSKKDQISGSSYLATGTSRGVPVHMDTLIQLKMKQECRMFMFGYKDRA